MNNKLLFLTAGGLFLVLLGFGWLGWWSWQQFQQNEQTAIELPELKPSAPTAESAATTSSLTTMTTSLTVVSPKGSVTPSFFPSTSPSSKPVIKPSPTPVLTLDLSFTTNYNQISRMYNDGANAWQYQSASVFEPVITWVEINPFWDTLEDTCAEMATTAEVASSTIDFEVLVDGSLKKSGQLSSQTGIPAQLPAQSRYYICYRGSEGVGVHTVTFRLNTDKKVAETNYGNNQQDRKYEIKSDTVAPTYDVIGPHQETEGTCFHINSVQDNVFSYNQLTKENRFDSNGWSSAENRLCLQGQSGSSHTYFVKVSDPRGNTTEKSQTFVLP